MDKEKKYSVFTDSDKLYHYLLKYELKSIDKNSETIDDIVRNILKIILDFDIKFLDIFLKCKNYLNNGKVTCLNFHLLCYDFLSIKFVNFINSYNIECVPNCIYWSIDLERKYNVCNIYFVNPISEKKYSLIGHKKCSYFDISYINKYIIRIIYTTDTKNVKLTKRSQPSHIDSNIEKESCFNNDKIFGETSSLDKKHSKFEPKHYIVHDVYNFEKTGFIYYFNNKYLNSENYLKKNFKNKEPIKLLYIPKKKFRKERYIWKFGSKY